MKSDNEAILTGNHFLDGDHACCEGAIAAGCRFVAGYPITPSTEVVERIAQRFPLIGGIFIQMEDEIASSIAIAGASWAGKKSMTVTSGPGFSLMMEHIGLAAITETPMVFVNVQRGGPSTGLPTLPAQSDMMQARWGSHGDYEIIALSPNSPQECFNFMIDAFNLSEQYRVPVLFMMDECVGHMIEKVVIPEESKIKLVERKYTSLPPDKYLPFKPGENMVPEFVKAGDGYKIHVTGLTHNEKGYPVINAEAQDKLVRRLVNKIKLNSDKIIRYEEDTVENADVVVVSYGITSRVCIPAINEARAKGIKVGHLRLIVVWPFPEKRIREISGKIKSFVVPELNLGQIFYEVERNACGKADTYLVSHAGGTVHNSEDIYNVIMEAAK
ncbi:MAG: 2-oxoacid:acceptor oxidoreductase subunit alpha [Bacteroidia bacterium]|nr:2-oxoacid:acceptor oxidoreductase subunit alpha [Bacteroidia bacterium]